MPHPQNARDAHRPGSYKLAVRVLQPEINPGERVELEVYITGYGVIRGSKLVFTPPPNFIDENPDDIPNRQSTSEHGYRNPQLNVETILFGGTFVPIHKDGIVTNLHGLRGYGQQPSGTTTTWDPPQEWGEATTFWDAPPIVFPTDSAPTIASEMKRDKAPIVMSLQTTKNVSPGSHSLQFHFTYFNGTQWVTDSQVVDIAIRNWFQQYHYITWAVGIIAGIIALASLGLNIWDKWDLVQTLFEPTDFIREIRARD